MKVSDIHWVAGLLEGEGYFGFTANRIEISTNSTDKDIVERLCKLIGGYTRGPIIDKRGNRKPLFRSQVTGRRAAEIMMTIYSLMSERRQGRIKAALQAWKSKK